MHSVVVSLDRVHAESVEQLWDDLESRFGVRAIQGAPFPHLSLQDSRSYEPERMSVGLDRLARRPAFRVHAHVYGIFCGQTDERLSFHVPLFRTKELTALHDAVRAELVEAGDPADGGYEPQNWSPHVTIADRDLTADLLGNTVSWLARRPHRSWTIDVGNLTLMRGDGTTRQIGYQVRLLRRRSDE